MRKAQTKEQVAVIRMKRHRQSLMEIHPRMVIRMEIHQPCLMKNQVVATIRMNSSAVMPAMENRKECREVQTLRKAVKI